MKGNGGGDDKKLANGLLTFPPPAAPLPNVPVALPPCTLLVVPMSGDVGAGLIVKALPLPNIDWLLEEVDPGWVLKTKGFGLTCGTGLVACVCGGGDAEGLPRVGAGDGVTVPVSIRLPPLILNG